MLPIILFFALNLNAAPENAPLIANTFPRDNTFCSTGKNRIEYLIRGPSKFTQEKTRYGEYLFWLNMKKEEKYILPPETGHFRLLSGKSSLCTKGKAFRIGKEKVALLLQKDNRPFKDLLAIQFFDAKTFELGEILLTKHPIEKAQKISGGFAFKTYSIHPLKDLIQLTYENEKYLHQEKNFPFWLNYTEKGFEINPHLTFKNFEYKSFFKDENEFLKAIAWDKKEKVFHHKYFFHGVSHKLKKDCIIFTDSQDVIPTEGWVCQTKNAE